MRYLLSILLIILFGFTSSYAIQCNDSKLQNEYNKVFALTLSIENEAAMTAADDFIKYLETNNLTDCEIYFLTKIEKTFIHIKNTDLVVAQALIFEILGNPYIDNHKFALAKAYIMYALIVEWAGNGPLCLENLDNAIAVIDEYNLEELLPLYYVRRSSYERIFGDSNIAFENSKSAIKYGLKHGDRRNTHDAYMLYCSFLKNRDTTIFYSQKIIQNYLADEDKLPATGQYLNLSRLYRDEGNSTMEKVLIDSAYLLLQTIETKRPDYYLYSASIMEKLQEYYERNGMIDSAYHYVKISHEQRSRFDFLDKQKSIEKNELKLNLVQKDTELKLIEKDKKNLQRGLIFGFVLSALILLLLIDVYRKRFLIKQQNKDITESNNTLKESNRKNEILLTEIHHRVKNNLQNVISLLFLKSNRNDNPEIQETLTDVTNKINSIAITHDQLYSSNEFDSLDFSVYIESLLVNCTTIHTDKIHFTPPKKAINLNIETVFPLGIILTELLANTSKHNADKKDIEVNILLEQQEESYYLSYSDNGQGFPEDFMQDKGIGVELIEILTRQIRGKLKFSNQEGARTEIHFKEKVVSKI